MEEKEMDRDSGECVDAPEIDAEVLKFVKEPGRVHYVAFQFREGVAKCVHALKQRHYEPTTSRNNLFHVRDVEWNGLKWLIVSLPDRDRHLMKSVATAHGLRIVAGTPTITYLNDVRQFPVSGLNVFTIENTRRHPVFER